MSDTPVPVVAEASDVATTVAVEDNISKSTLFVRGLPYDATSAQLEEFFSEVGPVRSCFVVLDRSAEQEAAESSVASGEETGIAAAAAKAAKTAPKNRGYGFVQFVLPEDADKALIELRSTKFLKQKPLLMEKAKKRTHEDEGKPKKEFKPKPKTDKPKKEEVEEPKEKNYSFQTVVLKGLGKDITKKHIYKRVRKVGDVKEVIYPVTVKAEESTEEANGEEKVEEGTAHVIYSTSALAASAVKALDGHIFKSCALHATLLASPAVYKRCRLIIRNLPWKYREQELRALFTKFGTVHEINLPRKFEGGPLRGFGFVQMENLEATEKAVQALNGTEHHGRTIAVDWALAKDRFEESEANSGANAEVEETSEEAAQEDQEVEMEGATAEDGDEEEGDENDDEDEEEEGDDDESDDAELDLDHLKGSDDEEAEDSDEDENMDEEGDEEALAALDAEEAKEKEQSKMTLPEPSEGTTLFIRNLDFEATKDDLFELFRHWGKLRYCRVTMDHETGRSRGTGFVCFYNKGAADNCMAGADKVAAIVNPIQAENDRKKKNNFVKHTILQPDLPEDLAVKFTLNGRVLNVVRAVDKTSAVSLLEAGQHKREREDRRNLYLMREGVIFPDSPAAASILPGELSKRQASFSARRALLARNPSLFISKARLSIRNLPLKLDEKELRKLGVQAVQKFKNEVKDGKRAHLTPEEQAEGWDKRVFVKQAKVIRSKDRVDGDTQQLRSKGYGFLEYSTHSHALAGLRWLNNNPSLFGEKKCLIVEFSIENVMVNKQRSERETRRQTKRPRGDNEEEEHEEEHAPEKKRPRKSIHEGGGRDHDRSESRGGFRGGRGRGGSDRGAPRGGSRGGFRGGARGGSSSRGGFGDREGSRGGFGGRGGSRGGSGDRGGSRGGFGDRGGSRGGFGGRGGSRGGFGDRGGSRGGFGGRGGSRGGRGDARGSGRGGRGGRGRGRD